MYIAIGWGIVAGAIVFGGGAAEAVTAIRRAAKNWRKGMGRL